MGFVRTERDRFEASFEDSADGVRGPPFQSHLPIHCLGLKVFPYRLTSARLEYPLLMAVSLESLSPLLAANACAAAVWKAMKLALVTLA